jgi:hypothetical protein
MFAVSNPEVLAREWLPPLALGREREVQEVVRRLDPPTPHAPPPWVVAVAGRSGAGSSTVARRAAREVVDRLRAAGGGPAPRAIAVRTALLHGAHGVASALLQRFDEGFDGRGFPTAEILAGFLRRLRRDGRPTVLVLDDIEIGGAELTSLLNAIGNPNRFLPEGESGLPPLWTVLAGSREGLSTAVDGVSHRFSVRPFLELSDHTEPELRSIVRDRLERAVGRAPPSSLVTTIVARAIEDGGGARRAVELLRRELLRDRRPRSTPWIPVDDRSEVAIEPWVVRAISSATRGTTAELGEVRRLEAELARSRGVRPLPPTTLWRRMVRLERAGYLRREIRTGGAGGTRSIVRLLTPVDDWVTSPHRLGNPRAAGPVTASPATQAPGELRAPPGGAVPAD